MSPPAPQQQWVNLHRRHAAAPDGVDTIADVVEVIVRKAAIVEVAVAKANMIGKKARMLILKMCDRCDRRSSTVATAAAG